MIKILLCGALGKMGKMVAALAKDMPGCEITAGVDAMASGEENVGFPLYRALTECREAADVIIDFSRPEALAALLSYSQLRSCGLVLCTTGYSAEQLGAIKAHAAKYPVFQSANMSLGVNLQMELCRKAAALLGDGYDVEIVEKHHNQKVDAPSGTALALADAVIAATPSPLEKTYGREGRQTKRRKNELGIHAVRGGTVVGEHNVYFFGADETIELTHIASSRAVFAAGALRAAKFLSAAAPGLYNMQDIVTGQGTVAHMAVDEKQAVANISLAHEPRLLAELFGALAKEHIVVDMISQTMPASGAIDLAFSLSQEHLPKAIDVLKGFSPSFSFEINPTICKITLEGRMEKQPGVAARLFELLAKEKVLVKLITTSETKIEFCVDECDVKSAVAAAKRAFAL